MNINLHIERLTLDGITVPYHQFPALQMVIESELTRLLLEGGVHSVPSAGGSRAYLRGDDFQMAGSGDPEHLGQQIARSVYTGINSQKDSGT